MFLSILADSHCILCGKAEAGISGLCAGCSEKIIQDALKTGSLCRRCSEPVLSEKGCPFCGALTGVDSYISLTWFQSYVKELLLLYKTGKELRLRHFFARMVHDCLPVEKTDLLKGRTALVPVPPRRGKIRRQGWDQVDLLCSTLHKKYGYRVLRLLKRSDRVQQKTLGLEERAEHMEGVLGFGKGAVDLLSRQDRPEKLILLDDILTSGATLGAASSLLNTRFDGRVEAIVICRVI